MACVVALPQDADAVLRTDPDVRDLFFRAMEARRIWSGRATIVPGWFPTAEQRSESLQRSFDTIRQMNRLYPEHPWRQKVQEMADAGSPLQGIDLFADWAGW